MDILFGKTALSTEDRHSVVSLDKTDRVTLVLGINRVEVRHTDEGWTLTHTANVVSKNIPRTDSAGFVSAKSSLTELL